MSGRVTTTAVAATLATAYACAAAVAAWALANEPRIGARVERNLDTGDVVVVAAEPGSVLEVGDRVLGIGPLRLRDFGDPLPPHFRGKGDPEVAPLMRTSLRTLRRFVDARVQADVVRSGVPLNLALRSEPAGARALAGRGAVFLAASLLSAVAGLVLAFRRGVAFPAGLLGLLAGTVMALVLLAAGTVHLTGLAPVPDVLVGALIVEWIGVRLAPWILLHFALVAPWPHPLAVRLPWVPWALWAAAVASFVLVRNEAVGVPVTLAAGLLVLDSARRRLGDPATRSAAVVALVSAVVALASWGIGALVEFPLREALDPVLSWLLGVPRLVDPSVLSSVGWLVLLGGLAALPRRGGPPVPEH